MTMKIKGIKDFKITQGHISRGATIGTATGDVNVKMIDIDKSLIENAMPHSIFVDNNDLSSYSLGIAGYNCFLSGTTQDVMPLYLRKSQAERVIEEKIIEAK